MMTYRCCHNEATYDIDYDCRPDENLNLRLCSYHYNLKIKDPVFSRKVISMRVLPTIEEYIGLDEE